MTPSTWILLSCAASVVLVLLAWRIVPKLAQAKPRRFRCPLDDRPVECEVIENQATRCSTDVRRCSAFTPPERILCARECLGVLNRALGPYPDAPSS